MNREKQTEIFKGWLRQYRLLLLKITRAYVVTEEDMDDLFQEICIQVWRSVPNFRGESAVSTWLYRVAFNTAVSWKRKEKRHDMARFDPDFLPLLHKAPEYTEDPRLEWLYLQIGQMNELDRLLTLLLLEDHSYKEIAEIAGISSNHVGVKLNRIKQKLISRSKNMTTNGI